MVAVDGQVVCVKIQGRADFNLSLDLKRLIDQLRHRGCQRFVLELGDCVMMDSTFLGMIAGYGLKFCNSSNPKGFPMELMNPNPRIADVLESLGIAHLFKIVRCPDGLPSSYESAGNQAGSKADITRNCLEAHRTLISLNPENAKKFKDVAEFLAEDLKRLEMAGEK